MQSSSVNIAIVGRPNVGKSTLFNRLTKTRNALVADFPGLTRDRQYGNMDLNGIDLTIVDTGGLGQRSTDIEIAITTQTEIAIEEAVVILFVVDGRTGITVKDDEICKKLRKFNKKIILVINKIDGKDSSDAETMFYRLGLKEMAAISAEHGTGIEKLIKSIANYLTPIDKSYHEEPHPKHAIKVACLGKPNAGKSTLINSIINENRLVTHDLPGTTTDSIQIAFVHQNKNYIFIDTAGIRRRNKIDETIEKLSVIKTLKAIEEADIVLIIVDATTNLTEQDLKLIGIALERNKPLVLAVNKWDKLTFIQRTQVKKELERRLKFIDFITIHFISALHKKGIGNLFQAINRSYQDATLAIPTSKLSKILSLATENHHPPMINGKEIKLRYAHIGSHFPLTIIIHGVRSMHIPKNYQKYLEDFFRKSLQLRGTPIKIIFKSKN